MNGRDLWQKAVVAISMLTQGVKSLLGHSEWVPVLDNIPGVPCAASGQKAAAVISSIASCATWLLKSWADTHLYQKSVIHSVWEVPILHLTWIWLLYVLSCISYPTNKPKNARRSYLIYHRTVQRSACVGEQLPLRLIDRLVWKKGEQPRAEASSHDVLPASVT